MGELWIILEGLVRGKKLNYYEIGIFLLKCIIFASLGILFLFGATKLPVVGKILNKVKSILGITTKRLISGQLIAGTIIYEILTAIILGVGAEFIYIYFSNNKSFLYHNHNTLEIINNFNLVINNNKNILKNNSNNNMIGGNIITN